MNAMSRKPRTGVEGRGYGVEGLRSGFSSPYPLPSTPYPRLILTLVLIFTLAACAGQKPKAPERLLPVHERSVAIPGDTVAVFALDGQWAVLTSAPPSLLLISPTGETVKTIPIEAFEGRDAVSDGKAIYARQADSVMVISQTGTQKISASGNTALVRGPDDKTWAHAAGQAAEVKIGMELDSRFVPAKYWVGQGDDLWLVNEKGWTRAKDGKTISPPPPGELKAALSDLLLVVKDGKFRPWSLQKNELLWSRKLPSPMREAFELGGVIYMASEDGLLHRFTKVTGFENATYDLQQRGSLHKAQWAGRLMIAPQEGRSVTSLSADANPERIITLPLHLRLMGMAASGDRLALLMQGRDDKFSLELYHR